jgi:group I intron endonuclease
MITGYVYKITNKIDGMMYVGQTIQALKIRFSNHCTPKSKCMYLKNAIASYSKDNFSIEPLVEKQAENKKALRELLDIEEIRFIKELNTLAPNGYNLTTGGRCTILSQETVLANAEKHKKPIKCNETGEVWPSIKECAQSFGVKNEAIHRVLRGVRDHFHGMSFSYVNPERSKPRKIRKRKIRSLESYDLSGLHKRIENQKRPIRCNETGQTWVSIQEAADFFGVKNETIHRVLRGIRKHFKKLTFSYI